jgi:hypothetical protein
VDDRWRRSGERGKTEEHHRSLKENVQEEGEQHPKNGFIGTPIGSRRKPQITDSQLSTEVTFNTQCGDKVEESITS